MIGDSEATNVDHAWTTRALVTRGDNAHQEGDQYAIADFSNANLPVRSRNFCQIVRKTPRVTGTAQAMSTVAISDLMADQIAVFSVEFKTDIEHALLRGSLDSGPSDQGDTASIRRMAGAMNALEATDFSAAAQLTLSETEFNDLLEVGYTNGSKFSDCLAPAFLKRRISTYTDSQTKFISADDMRIVNSVEVYESDFHITTIHKSRDMINTADARSLVLFDREFFAKAWLRRPFTELLPITGDDQKAVVLSELTFEFGHSQAGLAVTNIGT